MAEFIGVAGFGFFAGESLCRGGLSFFPLGGSDTLCAGGEDKGFEFFFIHLGNVFFIELVEWDVLIKVVKMLSGFVHQNGNLS